MRWRGRPGQCAAFRPRRCDVLPATALLACLTAWSSCTGAAPGDTAGTACGRYLGDGAQDTSVQDQGREYAGDTREDLSGRSDVQGRDTSGPTTDDAMTRSEERLHVGTEQAEVGRARLRKHVVTENVTTTVPVSHEEVRLEREPITEANRGEAMSGSDISEEEHEVTLHAERPVIAKETVPVERVRLGKETVTEDHEVSETLRKEQIDDLDTDGTNGTTR